jgi:IS1 family transposase/DNA-directed RNA polymerase subunit RPC12/RpoP
MTIEITCPTCGSHDISKNGTTRRGKQNYKCRDCNRQFVEDPQWKPKDKDTRSLVNLLLLKKIALAGIARATGVSESWLQGHANACYEAVPKTADVVPKAKGNLNVQMDELWSFVDNKGNKQWVWLAIDADTREIIGCHIGDCSRASAIALWQFIPGVYRTMRQGLHRLLGGVCRRHPEQTACCCWQRQWLDELHRKTKQHPEAADFSAGEEDTALFQEARESHQGNLDIHP